MKPSSLLATLIKGIPPSTDDCGLPFLVKGPPGVGKSDIVAEAARACNADLAIFHPVVSDPTDFKGQPWVVNGKAEFLPYGDLRRLLEAKNLTVAFLDDLGQAPPSVQAACMQLLLARRINGFQVPDCVTFLAATNRRQDRAAVTGILEPVKSRFVSILELEADADEWSLWALKHSMPAVLVAFLRLRPGFLTAYNPSAEITNTACPRTVANVGRLLNRGLDGLEVVSGAAGEGFAAEFLAFLRLYRDLPSVDSILLNPASAKVPAEVSALCAVAAAVADNPPAAFVYLTDLEGRFPDTPPDFPVLWVATTGHAVPFGTVARFHDTD